MNAKKVLNFWFKNESKWWVKEEAFDAEITSEFAGLYEDAASGKLDNWVETDEGILALIIVLDQFPRNMFRGDAKSFAADNKALKIVKAALRRGVDFALEDNKRAFLYMPLMHSEDIKDQELCVELFETYGPEGNLIFARKHLNIIRRFGRFPHRNEVLSRKNTPEENVFLTRDGSGF